MTPESPTPEELLDQVERDNGLRQVDAINSAPRLLFMDLTRDFEVIGGSMDTGRLVEKGSEEADDRS